MKIVTHSGSFHADDIFAVAILLLAIGESQVIRTRAKAQIDLADYVVDVGMVYDPAKNRFDHHQPGGAGGRPDGIPYASSGLVWKEFGERLAGGRQEADLIEVKLIEPLDAHDNGVTTADYRFKNIRAYSIMDFFYSFLPSLHESEESLYRIFMHLVGVVKDLLIREIDKAKNIIEGETKFREAYEASSNKRIIILSEELPWRRILSEKLDIMFIIYPRNDGQWSVSAAQDAGFISRQPFPVTWAGKTDKDLQDITGVSNAVFCHKSLFMAVAETKEGAVALAKIALNA